MPVPHISDPNNDKYLKLRKLMVLEQVLGRGITDKRILDAMKNIPRHRFVPTQIADMAYSDKALPIGCGQTISQPYMVAMMAEALSIKSHDILLEIGAGCGYAAAVMGQLCEAVLSVELEEALAEQADDLLHGVMHYNQVTIKACDGTQLFNEGEFDKISVTVAAPMPPEILFSLMKPRGKMVMPLGGADQVQILYLFEKSLDGHIIQSPLCPVEFAPLRHH